MTPDDPGPAASPAVPGAADPALAREPPGHDPPDPLSSADSLDSPEPPDPREPPRASRREAALIAAAVAAGTAVAVGFAFNPARGGSSALLAAPGALYALLAAFAVAWLRRRGELRAAFRPRSGDLARGAFVAAALYGLAMAVQLTLAPRGSPREAWILRLYLQLGDPSADARVFVGAAVFVIAALEEVVWRGLVMRALEGPLGLTAAWLLSSALFAAAHLPTLFLLGDPFAGPNPLLVAAGLGCSLVWGRVVHRTGRLPPAIFAHAFFSWAIVSFPIWRP
ncbi:CPBP family intramembrane glutamic endopeptidase [Sorangium sp. So ce131]|uniref:CPBP family intramembrane glutamic endopeptidase n=1 Tax=Sorangium sp. So ce131 TaxID=3133282 RepID=UPI003F636E52